MAQNNPSPAQGESTPLPKDAAPSEAAPNTTAPSQNETAPKITARGIFALESISGGKGDPAAPLDDLLFVPTHLAQGPWFSGALHGGAIVGLAAYAAKPAASDAITSRNRYDTRTRSS